MRHDGDERPDAFSDHRRVFVVFREAHEQVVGRTALPQEWCHASQMLVWARVNVSRGARSIARQILSWARVKFCMVQSNVTCAKVALVSMDWDSTSRASAIWQGKGWRDWAGCE